MPDIHDRPFLVAPGGGLDAPLGQLGTVHKIAKDLLGGRIAIVEHTLAPGLIAAPLHRHTREDELSIVLEGTMGALLGEAHVEAAAGSYVLKPRDEWHTFWNAGAAPLRFIELLIPGGFDDYFRRLSPLLQADGGLDPAGIQALADEYGLAFDFTATEAICRRFGVRYG